LAFECGVGYTAPKMKQPLPIDPLLPQIVEAVRLKQNVVLTATPGAGKTTRLPPALLNAVSGKILVLEPRRMAAVAAATRVSEETGWKLGHEVGYQVRFDTRVSRETRLFFVTDALALRQLVSDPELNDVSLIVIDEFHERNLNQDLMLGCLRELQELGSPIKILVMSATLDIRKLLDFLPGSVHVDVPGQVFPLEIRHALTPLSSRTDNIFVERVANAVEAALRECSGDLLVFLPGVGEIMRVREKLEGRRCPREIQILHGSLSLNEQQKVLRGSLIARVILTTNVAEASVTVEGVAAVIDCGLAKIINTDHKTGFSALELSRIAYFNARQRSGRAARQGPGICWRLWTMHEEVTWPEEMPAEIERSDLAQAFLFLAHMGVSDFAGFAWLDSPPTGLMSMASRSLRAMGALDSSNRLTDLGRRLIQFPLPPRWGALLALGESLGLGALAARMAALLSERDLLADARSAPTTQLECDLLLRLELLEEFENGKSRHVWAPPVLDAVRQLEGMIRKAPIAASFSRATAVRKLLLLSQRDRLARRRGGSERALMTGGRGVKLSPETQVRDSEFFVALNGMDRGGSADTVISVACGISKDVVLSVLKDVIEVREDIHFETDKGQFFARRVRYIDDLPIDEPSLTPVDPASVGSRLVDVLVDKWDWFVAQHEGLLGWMQRLRFAEPHDSRFSLSAHQIRDFIEMAAYNKTSIRAVLDQDLVSLLEGTLDRTWVNDFKAQLPTHFTAATGHEHKVHYNEPHAAYVEVRLQEMFGVIVTPRILGGKLPITFRLLGPNYRPVQVTSDIGGFWKGAYIEVRKELRSRYPKHSWPDDPLTAVPEARGRRRS
jgi:ATP-dependent helicase HrpB